MMDSTPLRVAHAWSPPDTMTADVMIGSVPSRPCEPASGRSGRSRGEHPHSDGISASARENPERYWSMVRTAVSCRAGEACALPTGMGTAHSGKGDLPRFVETKDATRLREALRDARRANGDSRIEPSEGAGMANRASPNARRESRTGRSGTRRWAIRRLDRDCEGSGHERSAIKRAHPASCGNHCPVGDERFGPGLPNSLKAVEDCRAAAGERLHPPFGARLADGIATNSRRFDMHRLGDES